MNQYAYDKIVVKLFFFIAYVSITILLLWASFKRYNNYKLKCIEFKAEIRNIFLDMLDAKKTK